MPVGLITGFTQTKSKPGLVVTINGGTAVISGSVASFPIGDISLQPNATNFIYLNFTSGLIETSTSGFLAGAWPICTALTNSNGVITLTDMRPDIFGGGLTSFPPTSFPNPGGLTLVALSNPAAPSVVATLGSGATTWGYKVAAFDNNGLPTAASAQGSVNNASTLSAGVAVNTITWVAVPGAVSYKVYRTANTGGTPANKSLLATVLATSALSVVDDGSVNTANATPCSFNTTGGLILPPSTFSSNDPNLAGSFPVPSGLSSGHIGSGLTFDVNGNMWIMNPGHEPSLFFGSSTVFKWSQMIGWSPNGVFPDSGIGVSISGSISEGFDVQPGMLCVGWNAVQSACSSYVGAFGFITKMTATAALTAGQVVKIDPANPSAVVVCTTADTAAGIALGIVANSPGAGAQAAVLLTGQITTCVLGTGTASIGQFVIVDTTTNGRVKCTSTYTAGTIIGYALTSQGSVGGVVTVLVQSK